MMAGDIFIQPDPGLLLCKSICSRKGLEGQVHGKTLDWMKPKALKKEMAPTPQTSFTPYTLDSCFWTRRKVQRECSSPRPCNNFFCIKSSVSTIKKKKLSTCVGAYNISITTVRDTQEGGWCERPSLLRLCAKGPASLWLVVKITKLLERMNQMFLERTE